AWGLFAKNLGDLRLAKRCFDEGTIIDRHGEDIEELSTGLRNAAELEILLGHLPAATTRASEALEWARKAGDSTSMRNSHVHCERVRNLVGHVHGAYWSFGGAIGVQLSPLDSLDSIWQAEFRVRLGARDIARTQSLSNLATCEQKGWF